MNEDQPNSMSEKTLSPNKASYFMNNKPMLAQPIPQASSTADRKHRSYMKAELVRK
jgi:hypothetical protein